MARKRRTNRRRKSNPDIKDMLMSKVAYLGYGIALGFAGRSMLAATPVGDLLDDTVGKLFGGTDKGAIGMGAVHDPYGAIGMGAVHDPYGAIGMSSPHSLLAENAARNTMHHSHVSGYYL